MAKSMNGQSRLFDLTTSEGSVSATSSPASVDGVTRSDSPAGLTIKACGPEVARANRSAQRVKAIAPTIRATFGQSGFASSASADLTSSLVNRLKQRLPTGGSTVFAMTWKQKATPSGRSVSLLRASGHRTSDNGYGSWPSPDTGLGGPASRELIARRKAQGKTTTVRLSAAASWATPAARDWRSNEASEEHHAARLQQTRGKPLSEQVHQQVRQAGWPTPMAGTPSMEDYNAAGSTDYERKVDVLMGNRETVNGPKMAGWPTPTAIEKLDTPEKKAASGSHVWLNLSVAANYVNPSGLPATGSLVVMAKRGQLNPAHSRWLMGYQPEWDACAATVTRLSRRSRPSSSRHTSKVDDVAAL